MGMMFEGLRDNFVGFRACFLRNIKGQYDGSDTRRENHLGCIKAWYNKGITCLSMNWLAGLLNHEQYGSLVWMFGETSKGVKFGVHAHATQLYLCKNKLVSTVYINTIKFPLLIDINVFAYLL